MLKILVHSLRRQLVVALLWSLAAMLAAAVALSLNEFSHTVEEPTDPTQVTAVRTVSAIEPELIWMYRIARNLSTNRVLENLNTDTIEFLQRPERLQWPSLIDLVLVDREGWAAAKTASGFERMTRAIG